MDEADKITIARRYCDVAYLDGETAKRGVKAILSEMFAVRSAVRPPWVGLDLVERFRKLRELIEAEAGALEGWAPESPEAITERRKRAENFPQTKPSARRGAFLQQLRNRAFDRDLVEIQRAAEVRLDELRVPHLRERAQTARSSPALRRTLKEGVHEVHAALLSSDGATVISGTKTKVVEGEGRVAVWSLESGQLVRSFTAHPKQAVMAMARSKDDRLLITGSNDNTARVWAMPSGRKMFDLEAHRGPVFAVAISPDGALGVTAGLDSMMAIWDLETGNLLRSVTAMPDPVMSMAFFPDSRFLVAASMDGCLTFWDVRAIKVSHVLRGPGPGARAVALSRDGKQVISGHTDGSLLLWDMESRRILSTMTGHRSDVTSVRFTGFERAVSGSRDGTLRLWDLARGEQMGVLWGHTGDITDMDVDAEGRTVVSSSRDGSVREWSLVDTFRNLAQAAPMKRIAPTAAKSGVRRVATSLNGEWAATALQNGSLQVWDLVAGVVTRTLKGHEGADGFEWVHELRISEDGRALVTAARFNPMSCVVTLWDVESGEAYRSQTDISHVVGVSGDARWAVGVPQKGGGLAAWNLETGQIARRLPTPPGGDDLWNMHVSAGGDRAAYLLWHGNVYTVDVMATKQIHEIEMCWLPVAMSGNGNRLLTKRKGYETNDGVLVLDLDWDTGEVRRPRAHLIPNHENMALSWNGRLLAYQDDYGLILLDVDTGEELTHLRADARLTCSAFTPNSRTLIAGDATGAIHILDLYGIQ